MRVALARLGRCAGSLVALGLLALSSGPGLAGQATLASRSSDDDDERAEALVVAERAFTENCLMCHSAELTTRQRLTPKQWATEVDKMVGWGSPLPLDRKEGLVAWLSATYPVDRPTTNPERITPERVLAGDQQEATPRAVAMGTAGRALFAQHCAACHGPTGRGGEVGINLVERPILTRSDDFHATLQQGKRRMPSFGPILNEQARADLFAWLRAQRG